MFLLWITMSMTIPNWVVRNLIKLWCQHITLEISRDLARSRRTFWMSSSGQQRWHGITRIQRNLKSIMSNFIITTVTADGLAPLAAADTVMTKVGYTESEMSFSWNFRHWHRKCLNDNFRCSHSWKFHQNDICVSVYMAAISRTKSSDAFSLMKKFCIFIKISLKFVPKGPIDNSPALVQIMAWRRPGDKPLFEPMLVSLLTHIWVKTLRPNDIYMCQQTNHRWFRQWLVAWPAPSHYINHCWNIVNWVLRNKLQWNLNRNSYIFIHENAFENVVWKMAAILCRPQCVKSHITGTRQWLEARWQQLQPQCQPTRVSTFQRNRFLSCHFNGLVGEPHIDIDEDYQIRC